MQFTASPAFVEKLLKTLAALSHKYPEGKFADVMGEGLDELLKPFEVTAEVVSAEVPEETSLDSSYIQRGIRNVVRERDGWQCSFVSEAGHRCTATRFLEFDHIEPWSLGGSSKDVNNIRLLCGPHNRLRAKETFGGRWKRDAG